MKRRNLLAASAAAAMMIPGMAIAQETTTLPRRRGRRPMELPHYTNEHFYKDGVFQKDIATEAYFEIYRVEPHSKTTQLVAINRFMAFLKLTFHTNYNHF